VSEAETRPPLQPASAIPGLWAAPVMAQVLQNGAASAHFLKGLNDASPKAASRS
jgi:hypothetical protein